MSRNITLTRVLGQSLLMGDIGLKVVAINDNKVRLVLSVPDDVDIEDLDDFEELIKTTIIMADGNGWRRAIPKDVIETLSPININHKR